MNILIIIAVSVAGAILYRLRGWGLASPWRTIARLAVAGLLSAPAFFVSGIWMWPLAFGLTFAAVVTGHGNYYMMWRSRWDKHDGDDEYISVVLKPLAWLWGTESTPYRVAGMTLKGGLMTVFAGAFALDPWYALSGFVMHPVAYAIGLIMPIETAFANDKSTQWGEVIFGAMAGLAVSIAIL